MFKKLFKGLVNCFKDVFYHLCLDISRPFRFKHLDITFNFVLHAFMLSVMISLFLVPEFVLTGVIIVCTQFFVLLTTILSIREGEY